MNGDLSIASDDAGSPTTARQILKVLRNPRLAAALFNAQLRIRGKARVPLSVRLVGRIHLRADGDVEFGQGVTLVGDVVPIDTPISRPIQRVGLISSRPILGGLHQHYVRV